VRSVRFPTVSSLFLALGLIGLLVAGILVLGRNEPGGVPGELWRRGLLTGEQVRLRVDGRYEIQRWGCFGPDHTIETGTWDRVGDIVSLVPSTPGARSRLMRQTAQDGERSLYDVAPDGTASPPESHYERVE
jgi:hypothetical protein